MLLELLYIRLFRSFSLRLDVGLVWPERQFLLLVSQEQQVIFEGRRLWQATRSFLITETWFCFIWLFILRAVWRKVCLCSGISIMSSKSSTRFQRGWKQFLLELWITGFSWPQRNLIFSSSESELSACHWTGNANLFASWVSQARCWYLGSFQGVPQVPSSVASVCVCVCVQN